MTTAGKRLRQIVIERQNGVTQDDYGQEVENWEMIADPIAEVLFGTGEERRHTAQEQATMPATFIVNWNPTLGDVKPKDRIVALGAVWDITSSIPVGVNKEVHITATRAV